MVVWTASYAVFLWREPARDWLAKSGLMRDGWGGLGWNLALTALVMDVLSLPRYCLVELAAQRRKHRPADRAPSTTAGQQQAAP